MAIIVRKKEGGKMYRERQACLVEDFAILEGATWIDSFPGMDRIEETKMVGPMLVLDRIYFRDCMEGLKWCQKVEKVGEWFRAISN